MIQSIDVEEACQLLRFNPNSYLIDVREDYEIDNENLLMNNYFNIAWNSNSDASFIEKMNKKITDKKALVIFLCTKGIRSCAAASLSYNFGYQNCLNIDNGISADFYQKLTLGII